MILRIGYGVKKNIYAYLFLLCFLYMINHLVITWIRDSSPNRGTFNKLKIVSLNSKINVQNYSLIKGNKTRVLIFASYRSGSSFVGSLLAVNRDVFYMFEPLGVLGNVPEHRKSELGCMNTTLSQCMTWLYNCKVDTFISFGKSLVPSRHNWAKSIFAQAELDKKIYFDGDFRKWNSVCEEYKHIAAKVIRGVDIEEVFNLLQQGVKVLYLVRDPRALAYSRYKDSDHDLLMDDITKECIKHNRNMHKLLKISKTKGASDRKLNNNFRILRYEDLIVNVTLKMEKIYHFIGLPVPESVRKLVTANIHVNLWKPIKIPEKLSQTNVPQLITEWRKKYSYQTIHDIQSVCKETMDYFQYMNVNSNLEKINENICTTASLDIPFML